MSKDADEEEEEDDDDSKLEVNKRLLVFLILSLSLMDCCSPKKNQGVAEPAAESSAPRRGRAPKTRIEASAGLPADNKAAKDVSSKAAAPAALKLPTAFTLRHLLRMHGVQTQGLADDKGQARAAAALLLTILTNHTSSRKI